MACSTSSLLPQPQGIISTAISPRFLWHLLLSTRVNERPAVPWLPPSSTPPMHRGLGILSGEKNCHRSVVSVLSLKQFKIRPGYCHNVCSVERLCLPCCCLGYLWIGSLKETRKLSVTWWKQKPNAHILPHNFNFTVLIILSYGWI